MKTFIMNDVVIHTAKLFCENFNIEDLLRDKKAAAGFVMHKFRYFSKGSCFHATNLFNAVFKPELLDSLDKMEGYARLDFVYGSADESAASYTNQSLIKDAWALTEETKLSKEDKRALFCIIVASFSLAGKSLSDSDFQELNAERLQRAYLNEPKETEGEETLVTFTKSATIALRGRNNAPYHIILNEKAKIPEGEKIEHKKIIAAPDLRNQGYSVTLLVHSSQEGKSPMEITLGVGEYVYGNFIGTTPVAIHPMKSESDTGVVERDGNTVFFQGQKKLTLGTDIIAVAAEKENEGWVMLYGSGALHTGDYSNRKMVNSWPDVKIVQLGFNNEECLLLSEKGDLYVLKGMDFQKEPDKHSNINDYI